MACTYMTVFGSDNDGEGKKKKKRFSDILTLLYTPADDKDSLEMFQVFACNTVQLVIGNND